MKRKLSFLLVAMLLLGSLGLQAFAAEDWLTLRVEIFDRSIAGFNVEDNMQLRYIQEKFGDPNKIKVQFVPVSRWDEGEILTTATTFRFDGSDLMPGKIGAGAFWTGMIDYVGGKPAADVAADIQKAWDAIK